MRDTKSGTKLLLVFMLTTSKTNIMWVAMEECRPLSAKKRWTIVEKIASGRVPTKDADKGDEQLAEEQLESSQTSLTE